MKPPRLLLLAVPALIAMCFPATAATIHVPDDQPTIQAGIDAASYHDTVLVACGTYYEHGITMESGVCLISETGLADCVTIDAEELGRIFSCDNVDNLASITGFTITGGAATNGGGMNCVSSSLTLAACNISGNRATLRGGGLNCVVSSLTLRDCTFSTNTADDGGAMHCFDSSPVLTGCSFLGNEADDEGGGICFEGTTLTLGDCVFSDNIAGRFGGGICSTFLTYGGLDRCAFVGNTAQYGAGVSYWSSSSPLTNCAFVGNTAEIEAGGLRCFGASSPLVTDCAFVDNAALSGGATYCGIESSPSLVSCLLSGNTATLGGACCCEDLSDPAITNCTFTENGAGLGGGLYCHESSPSLTNCIVAFSESGGSAFCTASGSAALTCCDVYGNAGGDWVGCIADQYGVNSNFSDDPLFCQGDNPGEPYSLHEGSSCLPENSPCGELVGALGQGCEAVTLVEDTSWGAIKAMYR